MSADDAAFIWRDDGDAGAKLVARAGDAHQWAILRGEAFRAIWPEGTKPAEDNPPPDKHAFFLWWDNNNDGVPQPDEVQMTKENARGITVTRDLAFVVSRFGADTALFRPLSFTPKGVPTYGLKHASIGPAGGPPPSSGGNQTLYAEGFWTIHANAPQPFSPFSLGGSYKGEPRWSCAAARPQADDAQRDDQAPQHPAAARATGRPARGAGGRQAGRLTRTIHAVGLAPS